MIKDYFLLFQTIQKNTQELSKVLSMIIVNWKTKENCIIFKIGLIEAYLVCSFLRKQSILRVFSFI